MFREGAVEAIPMAIGIAAWGLVAGVAMAKSGMGVPLSILMTLLVYAGSAQIATHIGASACASWPSASITGRTSRTCRCASA